MSEGIILFGELLLRLDPEGYNRLVQTDRFAARYTGGEANAGVALVGWGHEVSMISRVPVHEIGQACVNQLRRFGIDTKHVQRGGGRLGLFYTETGASQRPSQIIYDRAGSAFTDFSDEALDWTEVLRGAAWFHFTGTAPAVSAGIIPVLARACTAARSLKVKVSCDLNYRRKLWSPDSAARTMSELLGMVDVFVCGVEDAIEVFSFEPKGQGRDAAAHVAEEFNRRYGFSHIAVPMRLSHSASSNQYGALLYADGTSVVSRTYEITHIVDRIGTGDAMAAGLIHGILSGWATQQTIEFATAAACLKHSIPGDFSLINLSEVQGLVESRGSGRIQR